MTERQVRYFSRRTHTIRVQQLVHEVQRHPQRNELIELIKEQVSEDTHEVRSQVFFT